MVPFRGRNKFKQFVKEKPVKWGFKAFILADAKESYVYNWRLYTGKEGGQRCTGLAQKVVLELVEGLQYKGHVIYVDNYYTSLPLIKELSW